MSTRIADTGPVPLVAATRTAPRVTPVAGQPFRSVMQAGARAVVDSAESAVLRLPGGPVLAAAFRAGPPALGTTSSALTATTNADLADPDAAEGPAPTGANDADWNPDALAVTAEGEQNLYYLQLQQQISDESRKYTALSNVLKARHDMLKHAIDNIR
ncbi:MAG TPA: hypothetical protein VI197_06075 [Polyangiaceae bacterium]